MIADVTRVLCIDPHPFVGEWLAHRLGQAGYHVHAVAAGAGEAVALADNHQASIVVLEASSPDGDAFSAADDLARRRPHVGVLFFTASLSARLVWQALDAGALAVFGKSDPPDAVVAGVRAVTRAAYAFGPSVLALCPELKRLDARPRGAERPSQSARPRAMGDLTLREQEVLRLLAQGLQRRDIASRIHRSPKTVDKHRAAVMRKLDIHDRAKLVLFAIREGIVTP